MICCCDCCKVMYIKQKSWFSTSFISTYPVQKVTRSRAYFITGPHTHIFAYCKTLRDGYNFKRQKCKFPSCVVMLCTNRSSNNSAFYRYNKKNCETHMWWTNLPVPNNMRFGACSCAQVGMIVKFKAAVFRCWELFFSFGVPDTWPFSILFIQTFIKQRTLTSWPLIYRILFMAASHLIVLHA